MSSGHLITSDIETQIARLSERLAHASREDLESILNDVRSLLNQLPGNTHDAHTNRLLAKLQEIQQRAVALCALYNVQSAAPCASGYGGAAAGINISAINLIFLASTPLEISVAPFFSNLTRKLFEGINPFAEYLVQQRDPTGHLSFDDNNRPALTRVMGHHLRADISTVQFHALPPQQQRKITDGLVIHSNAASAGQLQDMNRLQTALDRLEATSTAAVYTSDTTTGVQEVRIRRLRSRFITARTAAQHASSAVPQEAVAARRELANALQAHILPTADGSGIMPPVAAPEQCFAQGINFCWGPHTIFSPAFTPLCEALEALSITFPP